MEHDNPKTRKSVEDKIVALENQIEVINLKIDNLTALKKNLENRIFNLRRSSNNRSS